MNFLKHITRNEQVRTVLFGLLFLAVGVPLFDTIKMGYFSPYTLLFSFIFLLFITANLVEWLRLK